MEEKEYLQYVSVCENEGEQSKRWQSQQRDGAKQTNKQTKKLTEALSGR